MKKILFAFLFLPIMAWAWEPTKPVRVIIGFAPGSGNETEFRLLATQVQKKHPNFQYVIEHKPGADTVLASNALYESAPDGYTISVPSYFGTYVGNDIWQKNLKTWEYNSFTNVMGMAKSPLAIVAHPSSRVNTPAELLSYIKKPNRPVNVAVGSPVHRLAFEYLMFKGEGNKDLVKHVNFQGPLQAVTGVASDSNIEFGMMPISVARPLVESKKVKIIAITGDKKLAKLPTVEPLKIKGSGINIFAAWALMLPPGTPPEIVSWYQRNFSAALETEEVKRFHDDNFIFSEPVEATTAGFNRHVEHIRSIWIPMSQRIDLGK
jgi:tripartite-type tricarboxylate transporter receptor subunit TctC